MNKTSRFNVKTVASIGISLLAIAFIAWKVNWSEISDSFAAFDALFLIPAVLIYGASFIFRAIRWQIFLREIKAIPFPLIFEVTILGWAANNLLPARLGEIVRAYAMGTKARISRSASLASILVERVFDGLILIFFLFVLLIYIDFPDWVNTLAWAGILLFGGIFVILALLHKHGDTAGRLISRIIRKVSERIDVFIVSFIKKFSSGLSILANPAEQLVILILTVIVWIFETASYFFVLRGFHMEVPLEGIVFALVVINMGILIPSSPGYVGTFQFFAILALGVFKVSPGNALSFAIILHAVQYIPVTAAGLIIMHRLGFSLKDLRHSA